MLTFEPPIYRMDGITVFRDHAQTELFYYAAPHPTLTRQDGRLMFDLHTYAVELEHSILAGTDIPDQLGAGFLTMGVDCSLSETRRRGLIAGLATQTGIREDRIILHPIPYHRGRVRLLALDHFGEPGGDDASDAPLPPSVRGRPTFVERILGSGTPSLLGDLRAIFSLALSQQGVIFLEGLYRDGAAPVGIVYELDFYGLRPALDVRIHADLARIYEHFGGGLRAGYQFLKAEIAAGIDQLEETGAVDVEITAQVSGDEAQKSKELALSLFKDRIVQELFRPTAPARPPDVKVDMSGIVAGLSGGGDVALTLRMHRIEELKRVIYDFRERSPEERTHSPQGFLPILLTRNELERRIHRVQLQSDFFEILRLLVSGPPPQDFDNLGIRQIQVRLIYPDDEVDALERTLVFRRDSTGDRTVAFRRAGRRSLAYTYQVTYEFEPRPGTDADALHYQLPPQVTTARSLVINPHADFGLLDVQVEAGRLHPDIKEVEAFLAYTSPTTDFRADERFRLDPTTRYRWVVRTRAQEQETYSATFTYYFNDGTSYMAPTLTTSDRLLVVNSPFRHDRRLLIRPNAVSDKTMAITVEIEYRDDHHAYHRRFLIDMTPPFSSREIAWPILDPDRMEIRYRVTVAEPGFLTEGEWQESDETSILVGGPVSRHAQVQIHLIGASLDEAGIDAVLVKITPSATVDPAGTKSLLFQPGQTAQEVTLFLPPGGQLNYRYQTTTFKSDGQVVESSWKESASTLLVISTRTL